MTSSVVGQVSAAWDAALLRRRFQSSDVSYGDGLSAAKENPLPDADGGLSSVTDPQFVNTYTKLLGSFMSYFTTSDLHQSHVVFFFLPPFSAAAYVDVIFGIQSSAWLLYGMHYLAGALHVYHKEEIRMAATGDLWPFWQEVMQIRISGCDSDP